MQKWKKLVPISARSQNKGKETVIFCSLMDLSKDRKDGQERYDVNGDKSKILDLSLTVLGQEMQKTKLDY